MKSIETKLKGVYDEGLEKERKRKVEMLLMGLELEQQL